MQLQFFKIPSPSLPLMFKLSMKALLSAVLILPSLLFANEAGFAKLYEGALSAEFAATGESNMRVGNAVLVRVVYVTDAIRFVSTKLLSCDGTWDSSPISVNSSRTATTLGEMLRLSLSADREFSSDSIEFRQTKSTRNESQKELAKIAPSLCRQASPERRGIEIPVTESGGDKRLQSSSAILSGTSKFDGQEIQVWIKSREFTREPVLDQSGKQVENFTDSKPTGVYQIRLVSVNCKARTVAYLSRTEYDANGTVLKEFHEPDFKKVRRMTLTPDTVGEGEVEAVCQIYAKKG